MLINEYHIYRDGSYYSTKSTYKPPAELLDSDDEAEGRDHAYDDEDEDEDEEVMRARSSAAQQIAPRARAYYVEEDPPTRIVQLDQGAGGQLDSVQRERHHEEVASDDEGQGYDSDEVAGEDGEEEEEEEEEGKGRYRYGETF